MISLLLLQSILHTFSQHAQTTCSSPTPLHISVHNSATDVLAGVCQAPPCWSRISSIFPSLCTSGLSVGHYHILSVLWNQLAFLSFGSLLRLDQASPFFKWLAPSQPLDVNSHVNFKKPALTTLSYEGPMKLSIPHSVRSLCGTYDLPLCIFLPTYLYCISPLPLNLWIVETIFVYHCIPGS